MIKKIIKITSIFLLVVISALIIIPIAFKGQIEEKVKSIVNENVNAQVDFGDFSLSLITTFPDFHFEINEVSVINKAPFDGDTLMYIGRMAAELDLMGVIGGKYVINELSIDKVVANAKITKEGLANWDIAMPDSSATEEVVEEVEEVEEAGEFLAGLESFSITNVNISYVDLESDMVAIIKNFNQAGSLILENETTNIDIKSTIEALTFAMEGDKYMNKVSFDSDVKIAANLDSMIFNFKENQFKLNELKLGVDGKIDMLEDMIFDLNLSAKENQFKDLLSLIPAVFKSEIEGIDTKGEFSLVADLKGVMNDEQLPAFDVDFVINDGFIKYPDLPESINDIQMDLKINNKDGIIDHTVVDLKNLHFFIAKNPVNIKYYVTDVESDPNMKGAINSKLQLENLSKVIPMEPGEEYKGGVIINLDFAGKLSAIEKEQYDLFKADGQVIFDGVVYKTPGLPTTLVKTGYLNFSPQKLEVSNFDLLIGKSDLKANGKIDNIFSYVFNDETLKGSFNIQSNYFDLDEFMAEDSTVVSTDEELEAVVASAETAEASANVVESDVVEVPGNIDFLLVTKIKKLDFDSMPITDLSGGIHIKDRVLHFKELGLNIFEGRINLSGNYNTQDLQKPSTDLDFSIDKMGIGKAYQTFNTVQKMAPIAKNATGKFSTDLKMSTVLTDSLTPVYSTLNGKGTLETTNLGIAETDAWKNLIKALKIANPKYAKIKAEDVKINYHFKDGKLYTSPFKLNLGDIKGEVSGWTSFDNQIEYKYALQIPTKALGGAAGVLKGVSSLASKNGIDVSVGEYILIDVIVSGDMTNPSYKVKPAGTSGEKSVKDQAIDQVKEKVNQEIDKAKEKAKEEAERLKKEAEEKVKAEADRLKNEAEAKAKEEAAKVKAEAQKKLDAEKKKAAEDLKNKLKKRF